MSAHIQISAVTQERPSLEKSWHVKPGKKFRNPWKSYKDPSMAEVASAMYALSRNSAPIPPKAELEKILPVHKPDFGASLPDSDGIKITWLGHACYYVEMPNGIRILFDPVFSKRCSPFSFMGPARFTPAPCTVQELPPVDIIILSHCHYDHCDLPTLSQIAKLPQVPKMIVPLNTTQVVTGVYPKDYIFEIDWWESVVVSVNKDGKEAKCKVTGTPAQHQTARGAFDRYVYLWMSCAVETLEEDGKAPARLWFSGDTSYSKVPEGTPSNDHTLLTDIPICPAFKEIGEHFSDGFSVAMIGIGAYEPRPFMSAVHCAPVDSVRIHQDIKARKSLGMHYGVWQLTTEAVDDPPKKLADARKLFNIPDDEFSVMEIGQSISVAR